MKPSANHKDTTLFFSQQALNPGKNHLLGDAGDVELRGFIFNLGICVLIF